MRGLSRMLCKLGGGLGGGDGGEGPMCYWPAGKAAARVQRCGPGPPLVPWLAGTRRERRPARKRSTLTPARTRRQPAGSSSFPATAIHRRRSYIRMARAAPRAAHALVALLAALLAVAVATVRPPPRRARVHAACTSVVLVLRSVAVCVPLALTYRHAICARAGRWCWTSAAGAPGEARRARFAAKRTELKCSAGRQPAQGRHRAESV